MIETIRQSEPVHALVAGLSGIRRVWPLTRKWGVILSVNMFQGHSMSFTVKVVERDISRCRVINSPNIASFYVNKEEGDYYFRGISFANSDFMNSMRWEYSHNHFRVSDEYLSEVSVEELTLNADDYGCKYDAESNTLYILFKTRLIGVICPSGIVRCGICLTSA